MLNVHVSPADTQATVVDATLLVIGVSSQAAEADLAAALGILGDLAVSLAEAARADEFKGAAGVLVTYPSFGRIPAARIGLVGLGAGSDDEIRRASGTVGSTARRLKDTRVALHLGALNDAQLRASIEGFTAGNYRFDKYRSEADRKPAATDLLILGEVDQGLLRSALAIAQAQNFARDLVNEPAAVIYPETLAEAALTLASDRITVTVWDQDRIRAEGMGGITGVGQGSARPPRFIHLHYTPPTTPTRTVALVGKGVTFDSGGLSLKPSDGMLTMRCDMGGSAIVLGTFLALRDLQPDVEVHGIIGAVENMCAANAYKLGDILRFRNGKTAEIHNTDAEGRLVLADCLSYASELKPHTIVDFATLTGACVVALGEYYTGLFTNHEDLARDLLQNADAAGEGLWRLPLPDLYKEKIKAEWADIKNVGGRNAGASTAALFLAEFVADGIPWAHCDVAGPTFLDKPLRHFASGATGQMVPTIVRWLCG